MSFPLQLYDITLKDILKHAIRKYILYTSHYAQAI